MRINENYATFEAKYEIECLFEGAWFYIQIYVVCKFDCVFVEALQMKKRIKEAYKKEKYHNSSLM